MSLSKALKSARARRSAKNSAVCKAESFSATAVATNWFMLVLSSLLCRSTALFSDRGKRRGYVIVCVIVSSFLSLHEGSSLRSRTSPPRPHRCLLPLSHRRGYPIADDLAHVIA